MMTIERPKSCQQRTLSRTPMSVGHASSEGAFAGGTGQSHSVHGPDQLDALPTRR